MRVLLLLALFSSAGYSQAPSVLNTRVDAISWSSARIQWNTDIPASMSQVQYGSTRTAPPFPYATEFKTATARAHGYRVGGLAPATIYYYRVCSTANSIQSCGPISSFATLPTPPNRFEPPTLPDEYVVPPMPTLFANTYTVADNCSDLQSKLNAAAAAPGSGNQLVLLPVATCKGSFFLNPRSGGGTGWIVVRPNVSMDRLPPEGVRVDSSWTRNMTTLSANYPGNSTGSSALRDAGGTSKWRLVGVQFAHEAGSYLSLVNIQCKETGDIILDRCILSSAQGVRLMMAMYNVSRVALVNSHMKGADPGGIVVGLDFAGVRQLTIANNYLNAPGITVFGEAGNGKELTTDVVVRRNLMEWDLAHKETMVTRQLFEFKQVTRALLEGNTFRNSWAGGITGQYNYTFAFTPRKSDGGVVEDSVNEITDLTIRNNIAHNVPGGFQLYGNETTDVAADVKAAGRWLITNLLMYDLNGYFAKTGVAVRGNAFVFAGALEDVVISNVTVFDPRGTGPSVITWLAGRGSGVKIQNSLLGTNYENRFPGVWWAPTTSGTLPPVDSSTSQTVMNGVVHAAPNRDSTFDFSGNVLIPGVIDTSNPASYSDPTKSYSPAACSAYFASLGAQCAGNIGTVTANAVFDSVGFRGWRNGDFTLRPDSPYYAKSNGKPVGADMGAIAAGQGWVSAPVPTGTGLLTYEAHDPSMQCYWQWNSGGYIPDTPGAQLRRVFIPAGATSWKLLCAGGSLPGQHAGEAAAFNGTLLSTGNNMARDSEAPSIALSSPAVGGTVSGLVSVQITAADDTGVTSLSLYVDGTLSVMGPVASYASVPTLDHTLYWNSAVASDGAHVLEVRVTDAAGHSSSASTLVIVERPSSSSRIRPPDVHYPRSCNAPFCRAERPE